MDNETKIFEQAKYVLKQYGVDATGYDTEIVDRGPDNISLILSSVHRKYFIAADDALSSDAVYLAQAKDRGLKKLTPLKLLRADLDGEYITMFGTTHMVCKVYET